MAYLVEQVVRPLAERPFQALEVQVVLPLVVHPFQALEVQVVHPSQA